MPKAMESFQSVQQLQVIHPKGKLHLTAESLLAFSRHVLDDLSPALAETLACSEVLVPAVCEEINKVFKALVAFSPTPQFLKQTQIHLALRSICEPDGGWPDIVSSRSEGLLAKWHEEIGELKALEDVVWGEDGALAGCIEVHVEGEHGWLIELKNNKSPKDSLVAGDLGYHPGFWWINRAAAVRDGVISSICNDITFGGGGAYAVIITGDRETGTDPASIEYDGTGVNGSFRFLTTMLRLPNTVRVLREHTSVSPHAPAIGIRYEGLYRVSRFFSKLDFDEDGSDRWTWRAYLEPCELKHAGPLRLARPDRHDRLIWKKYFAEREDHITKLTSADVDSEADDLIF